MPILNPQKEKHDLSCYKAHSVRTNFYPRTTSTDSRVVEIEKKDLKVVRRMIGEIELPYQSLEHHIKLLHL